MQPDTATRRQYKNLDHIDGNLRSRLTARISKDAGRTHEEATEILDATLGFLALLANNPHATLAPSAKVDEGWHTFILYTKEYAEFCQRIAGRFIHHSPSDDPAVSTPKATVQGTVDFMVLSGISYNPAMWGPSVGLGTAASCTVDCDGGGNGGGGACRGQCS